jgi:hypothetical protein
MGLILLPGWILIFYLFILGIIFSTKNISYFGYKLIFIISSILISLIIGYTYIDWLFSLDKGSKINAFKILFEVIYGKATLIYIGTSGLLLLSCYYLKTSFPQWVNLTAAALVLLPFSCLIIYFLYASKLFSQYGISVSY